MKKLNLFVLCLFCGLGVSWALPPSPMESVAKYNVILVHGAADSSSGFIAKCDGSVRDAYSQLEWKRLYPSKAQKDSSWKFGGAAGMFGGPHERDDEKVTNWLDSAIFEDYVYVNGSPFVDDSIGSSVIYIQRSFANPAESPAHNAVEIGDRTWKGDNNCSVRRSLFEEAQEVRAHGQDSLNDLRSDTVAFAYRSIPSRNIVISHSMGGVASREYVQGDGYNHDVDKLITLDSPHEGTGALSLLIDLTNDEWYSLSGFTELVSQLLIWTIIPLALDFNEFAAVSAFISFGTNWVDGVARGLTASILDYGYKKTDPLVKYINPEPDALDDIFSPYKPGIIELQEKTNVDSLPMFRLLYSQNALTFTDPGLGWYNSMDLLFPDALTATLGNVGYQLFTDAPGNLKYANVLTGGILGLLGVTVQNTGSSLIPESSGKAANTSVLTNPSVDVKRVPFNGAINTKQSALTDPLTEIVLGVTGALFAADIALMWNTKMKLGVKIAAVLAVASAVSPTLLGVVKPVIDDFKDSHASPVMSKYQSQWYGAKNEYSSLDESINDGNIEPYLIEDFLYEKPFVNLALSVVDTALRNVDEGCFYESNKADEERLCEVGLYGTRDSLVAKKEAPKDSFGKFIYNGVDAKGDSVYNDTLRVFGSFKKRDYKEFLGTPLKFKNASDWEKVGVKVDRWEKVDGLTPGGELAPKSVPIRHVERYNLPNITVDNWIEKYSFVVDDLMPHRLRQIKLNFNFKEEIAWECDITKPVDADDACAVYKRSGGGEWKLAKSVGKKGRVPHPVSKNGRFEFAPKDYGMSYLSVQKDNQNTVTITAVNKIGLSNSQRFYYLFKATENKLDAAWPAPDVVLNKIKGFKAYASALGYQGFGVVGATDTIWHKSTDNAKIYPQKSMTMVVDSFFVKETKEFVYDASSATFTSKQKDGKPAEGEYVWKFVSDIRNLLDESADRDSTNSFEIPFRVDRTAPKFFVTPEADFMNPMKNTFVARYAWMDSTEPDVRAMRWTLEGPCAKSAAGNELECGKSKDVQALYDVSARDFAVQWDDASRAFAKEQGDGLYRIKAYAVDYAVPDSAAYDKMSKLVNEIVKNAKNVDPSLWPTAKDSLNAATETATFVVDVTTPKLENVSVKAEAGPDADAVALARPAREKNYKYVTYDSLLTISYNIRESLNGRDSAAVTVSWNFVHLDDTTKIDRAGDSVWVKSGNVASAEWSEMAGMRLEDGDYELRAYVRDAAKNDSLYKNVAKFRVDKTAPVIASLVSTHLVYSDSATEFSAKIRVSEGDDIALNRTGMRCYYRVSGSSDTSMKWTQIKDKDLHEDTLTFALNFNSSKQGKYYLEAKCVDAAGNASVRTDLFYVGKRMPVISSPKENSNIDVDLVAITGVAPPVGTNDSLHTVYRLRYSLCEDSVWSTSNIFVPRSIQLNDSTAYMSKVAQSNDGVLGYINRRLPNGEVLEGCVNVELATCSGTNCISDNDSLWVADTSMFMLEMLDESESTLDVNLRMNRGTVKVGKDSAEISLNLTGDFNSSYLLRLYGEDANKKGVFEVSNSKVWKNPYSGLPKDTADESAVWFYEKDGEYHLMWRGFDSRDTLQVMYNSAKFGKTCVSANAKGNFEHCFSRVMMGDLSLMASTTKQYFEDFRELAPLSYSDSAMLVTGKSGHLVMTAEDAFRVSMLNAFDSTMRKKRVYFGSSAKDGFYWIGDGLISSDTLNPLMLGWTADPNMYGLKFVWNGLTSTGAYPAEGKMKIYAEVTENIAENPKVFVLDSSIYVEKEPVEISFAKKLSDFVLLKNDSSLVCKEDSCEKMALSLNRMDINFGIKNRDSWVSVYLMKDGKIKAHIQDSVLTLANVNGSAHHVVWDAKDGNGHASLEAGTYQIKIVAVPLDGSATKEASASFKLKLANSMQDLSPDDPKDQKNKVPSIYVSEALRDSANGNIYRYEPVADYLIDAKFSGWKFPDAYKSGFDISGTISGEQHPLGFDPKRFSLGIKRHRKQLDLVMVRRIHTVMDSIKTYPTCSEAVSAHGIERIDTLMLRFDSGNRELVRKLEYTNANFGFDGKNEPKNNFYDFVLFTKSGFKNFCKDSCELKTLDDYNKALNSEYVLWKFRSISGGEGYEFAYKSFDSLEVKYSSGDLGCQSSVDSKADTLIHTCVYGKGDTTDGYDPNKNLLKVVFYPAGDSGKFFKKYGAPNGDCTDDGEKRYLELHAKIKLSIPDSYWEAPFGMDNLVNRTIRFDHTNKTVYGSEGYLNKVKDKLDYGSYYDGIQWKTDVNYGLLTPLEMQFLPMFASNHGGNFDGGENIFLFDDETRDEPQPARYDFHFYGDKDEKDYFQVFAVGPVLVNDDDSGCETDSSKKILPILDNSLCQVSFKSTEADTVKSTPYFYGDGISFYVGRNKSYSTVHKSEAIQYPASRDWRKSVKGSCKATGQNWDFATKHVGDSCYKYYDYASKVHYYFGDYADSTWSRIFLTEDGYFKNLVNSPSYASEHPVNLFKDVLDSSKVGAKKQVVEVKPNADDYDETNHRFFVKLNTERVVESEGVENGLTAKLVVDKKSLPSQDTSVMKYLNDTLYINASQFKDSTVYRKTEDSLSKKLVYPNGDTLSRMRLINSIDSAWIKDMVIESAEVLQLDSTAHTHLKVEGDFPSSSNFFVEFLPPESFATKRPKELVELRAYLDSNYQYRLLYLNDSAFYVINDSLKKKRSGEYHLGWFNVNKLNGNTQFLLMWGDATNPYNFSKFDMVVGSQVNPESWMTVSSLFDEAKVSFPVNSLNEVKNVTVRTADPSDHPFEVFNDLALNGPVIEVLPSMTFPDTNNLPRIQMKISRKEMEAMHVTPSTIRLYKVDFTSKKFVPLENALYGFLDSKGAPVMNGQNTLSCNGKTDSDTRCTGDFDWSYLLISAETRTFSVFVALDSAVAEMPVFGFEIIPEVAATAERIVNVNGISDYVLYVDDDASLKDVGDSTPAKKLAFTLDANGYAHIALPERGHGIDTNYVLVVATYRDSTGAVRESPAAPAVGRALTVNAEFACHVPADSLWLGLDNGYMAYGAACTHPGHGTVSLYRDGKLAAEVEGEIPDTLVYDGFKVTGASKMGKIPSGVYESRYVGVSALGMDLQMAGPLVYTDSARPVVRDFGVEESADILDRVFTVTANVTDSESGVAAVVVKPVFGTDSLRSEIVHPDSLGNVKAMVRLTRKRLNECSGCKLTLYFSAEDYGHNHSDARYVSDKLYPYPADVALWYPSYEGVGSVAHEYLGTGHDLRLDSMSGPWQSDVGLYFGNVNDRAYGVDSVKFGASPAYSFEARVKRGNVQQMMMKRVLGFSGRNGLNMELQLNSLGDVQLVEGTSEWLAKGLLPGAKTWFHLVVTVDSAEVKFYVDGRFAQSQPVGDALAGAERELDGKFSVGRLETLGFIGNIADVRMYRGALTGEQVAALWMPIADDEEALPQSIVVAMDDFSDVNGLDRQFSCSVAGNSYFVSKQDGASFKMSAYAENAGRFEVVLYARSATLKSAKVSVVEGSSTRNGTVALSNVWRPVTVSGASLDLKAGVHAVTLKLPAGVQVGGVALVTEAYPASAIAWGRNASGGAEVAGAVANKVKTYVRYEGYPETTTLRPRIRMKNISGETIDGFSIRYYFRGEDASSANVVPYWPDRPESMPAVHSESARVGYVEWDFYNTQIPVNGMPFNGDGPHFGLYDTNDNDSWNAIDDPSFVDVESGSVANVDGYFEDAGIIVLDRENNLIGGACVEVEDEISEVRRVRVFAADVNNDVRSSEIQAKVENVGNVPLTSYELRYYFRLEGGLAPEFDVYDGGNCNADLAQSAQMTYYGGNLWGVSMRCERTLNVGKTWANPLKINLHVTDWMPVWNAADDPSHEGLSYTFAEAPGFCAYDSTGALIFGKEPDLGAARSVAGGVLEDSDDDSEVAGDYGYKAPDYSIPVARTDDGLVLTLNGYVYVELDLVNAVGMPVRSVFRGSLAPGEQHVHVDWKGIDLKRTYLVLRVNGEIKSTKLLSLM